MKRTISFILMVIALSFCVAVTFAADIESGGLYYKILSYDNHTIELVPSEGEPYAGAVVIPSTVNFSDTDWTVVSIGENAFYGSTTLQGCTIPNTVTRIGGGAFYKCKEVNSYIVIPEGVVSIGGYAFSNGTMVSMNLPSTLETIGEWAFCNSKIDTDIVIPENVVRIESMAFAHLCANVTLNNKVQYIGGGAFCENTVVTRIVCPETLVELDGHVFQGCTSLTEIVLPSTLKKLGTYANSTSLATITMPDSVKYVDNNAFYGCTNLTNINWSNFINNIGSKAFYSTAITEVNLPTDLKTYEYEYEYRVDTVFLGDRFGLEKTVTNVSGPYITNNGTVSIGSEAFSNCDGLTTVHIKENTSGVASKAFYGSKNITSVTADFRNPSNIADDAFSPEVYSNATLYVRNGRKTFYEDKTGWKNFNNIVELGRTAKDDADDLAEQQAEEERIRTEQALAKKYTDYLAEIARRDSINQAIADSIAHRQQEIADSIANALREQQIADSIANVLRQQAIADSLANIKHNSANLFVSSDNINSGDGVLVSFNITNESKITAFQADITFADSLLVDLSSVVLTNRAAESHTLAKTKNGNTIRLVLLSLSNEVLSGENGAVVTMNVSTSETLESGRYSISLSNVNLSDSLGNAFKVDNSMITINVTKPEPEPQVIVGDINGDGVVSVDDVVNIVNYIMGTNGDLNSELADADENGEVTINDVVILINEYILDGGHAASRAATRGMHNSTANIYANDVEMTDGLGYANVFLYTDYDNLVGFQCDLNVSGNFELVTNSNNSFVNKADVLNGKLVVEKLLDNGTLRVVVLSIDGSTLPSGNTNLFSVGISGNGNNGSLSISNIELSNGKAIQGTNSYNSITGGTTAINSTRFGESADVEGYYNLQGRRVNADTKGIVIVKYTNGTSKKFINR